MNRERFIRNRRGDWQQMETLLNKLRNSRFRHWRGDEITRLSRLYRSVCYDLSLVQSREWGARLEQYLNDLVAQGHNCLYRSPPRSLDHVLEFLSKGFPQLLRRRKAFFFVSLALFAIPFLISMLVAVIDPVLAERLVDRTAMEHSGESYREQFTGGLDEDFANERSVMAGFYVRNNIGIAFRCFALGVFFGIGTILTLLFNGIVIGATTGYLIHRGYADNFFSFAISHASFELTAIVVAGAAGLLLGWGLVHPGEMSRVASIRHHGMDAVKLACGAGFMLAIAALIEAYFSPIPRDVMRPSVKYVAGSVLWSIVYLYLVHGGRSSSAERVSSGVPSTRAATESAG